MAQRGNLTLSAFVGPCLPLAAIGLPLAVVLPNFYSSYVGLPIGLVGWAFLAVRFIDISFDPVIGWAMDRTRNRFGPYRTWFVLGAPILMLATGMIFFVRPGANFAYLSAWLLVLYLGFSVCTLAQLAWGAVLAPDYHQRSRLYGWWQAGNIVGVLAALAIPTVVLQLKLGDFVLGVRAMGGFIMASLPLTLLIALLAVPEPRSSQARPEGGFSAWLALFRRPAVRRVLLCDFLLGTAPGITGALLFYFFEYVKGFERAQSQLFMTAYFVAGLIGAPFWSWLAMRIGKHRALVAASLVYAAVYVGVGFLPARDFRLTLGALFLAGLPYAAGLLLTRAMMADVADEVRLETGQDRMGMLFSFLSFTTKMGYGVSVGSLMVLAAAGFSDKPHAHNGPQAILTLEALFIAAPTLLLVLAVWPLSGYPLGPKRHAEIRAALAARDAAA
jgi:GPH family glycoside/pentoside/hexuronide:cation symporter